MDFFKELNKIILFLLSSPIILSLIVSLITYALLPKCKVEEKKDGKWALETTSITFVITYLISSAYLSYYRQINLPTINISSSNVSPNSLVEKSKKIANMNGGSNLAVFKTGLPLF